MKFGTRSGTIYEIADDKVRRIPRPNEAMRGDNEWVPLLAAPHIRVGVSATLLLAPLGDGDMTIRTTSEVIWKGTP